MLKRLGLALLLLTSAAVAQTGTPTLINHIGVVPTSVPTSTSNPIDTTGATSAFMCARQGALPYISDSANNTWVSLLQEQGAADGDGCSWYAAWALKTSTSHTFTVLYSGPFVVTLWNHVASGPDQTSIDITSPLTATLGPVTPTHPYELLLSGIFVVGETAPPIATMDNATTIDTAFDGAAGYKVGYSLQGATATSYTNHIATNNHNGMGSSLITLYSDLSPTTLSVATNTLPTNILRTVAYPTTCINIAGGTAPYTITLGSGTLPPGITFDGRCLSGTGTLAGTFGGLVFHVVDAQGVQTNSSTLSIVIKPLVTVMTFNEGYYGYVVMPNAKKHLGVIETHPGTTGRVDYTTSDSSKVTLSCTTNCPGIVEAVVVGAPGTCTPAGGRNNHSVLGSNDATITATSRDQNEDGTYSTAQAHFHICKGDHRAETHPVYTQAWIGQDKVFMGYDLGQVIPNISWSCRKAEDSSNCGSMLVGPTNKRNVTFNGTAVGHYILTASSISSYDGSTATNYSTVYVGGAMPAVYGSTTTPVTPTKAEATACFKDAATFGSSMYDVRPDGAGDYTHIYDLPVHNQLGHGFLGRIINIDTTGSAPTQYADSMHFQSTGTRDLGVYICGVPDSTGHNPIIQSQNAQQDEGSYQSYGAYSSTMFWIVPTVSSTGPSGYETSNGPDFVTFTGLDFRADGGAANLGIAFNGRAGRHFALEGDSFDHYGQVMLLNDNTINTGRTWTEFQSVIGSYFETCSTLNSSGNHCMYIEGMHPLVFGNHVGTMMHDSAGSWIKFRGGETIMAFNDFSGSTAGPAVWETIMSDSTPYASVEGFLGIPSVDTNPSRYDTDGGDANFLHVMENEELLAHDYWFGNTLKNDASVTYFDLEGMQVAECDGEYGGTGVPCTNGEDHTGGLMIWNNTFDRPTYAIGQSGNEFYNNSGGLIRGVHSWPYITLQNNSMWTDIADGVPFVMDVTPFFQGAFKTNMLAPNQVKITSPIHPGDTGWGNQIGGGGTGIQLPKWTAYDQDKSEYIQGLTTANFLTTANVPYNARTMIPKTGSPLIGAGSAITDPLMAAFNLSYEPDVLNGFMKRRTADATTIGARSYDASAPQPTIVSQHIFTYPAGGYYVPGGSSNPISLAFAPGQGCDQDHVWDCFGFSSTWSDGWVENDNGRAVGWTSSDTSKLTFNQGSNIQAYAVAGAGTVTVSAAYNPETETITGRSPATQAVSIPSTPYALTVDTNLPNGIAHHTYTKMLLANGGDQRFGVGWSLVSGALPPGMILAPSAGFALLYADRLTAAGTYNFTLQVQDSSNTTATGAFTLTVSAEALSISTTSLNVANVNAQYGAWINVLGGAGGNTYALISGTLPPGLTFNTSNGLISNVPSTPGTYSGLVFRVTDSLGATVTSQPLTIVVKNAPFISPFLPTAGTVGSAYSYPFAALGGSGPYVYSVSAGALPSGLTLNSSTGAISGTPTVPGTRSAVFRVTGADSQYTETMPTALTVNPVPGPQALAVTTSSLPNGAAGSAYPGATLAAVGGTSPYTWARTDSNSSPPGIIILSNGTISGIPTGAGTYGPLTFRVTDSVGATADSPSYIIVISPAQAATPSFSPAAGTYTSPQTVSISSATSGATVCFTVDGTTPTANGSGTCTHGTTYSATVSVGSSSSLEAIATKSGFTDSALGSAAYTINLPAAATPTCSPAAGTYTGTQSVTCSSSTSASTTYCTLDGSTPTTSSPVCTAQAVASSLTLKAISVASGYTSSAILSQAYTINTSVNQSGSVSIGSSLGVGSFVIY